MVISVEKINQPALYCPFPYKVNKYIDFLEDDTFEWAKRFNILANASYYQRFLKARFCLLSSSAYPSSELEELKIATNWLIWTFFWDDQCDLSHLSERPELLKTHNTRLLQILNGAESESDDIPLAYALSDLRSRFLQNSNTQWFHRFVQTVEHTFNAVEKQLTYQKEGTIPSVETYIKLRRSTSYVYTLIEIIEFCEQITLPEEIHKHIMIQSLRRMANNILSWTNDIFSVYKEIKVGDIYNIVILTQHEQKISFQEAINYAVELCNQEVQEFIDLTERLPDFGKEMNAEVERYISGMRSWIRGHLDWYSSTGHYQTAEMLTIPFTK
ncbi:MAG: terpene synthase [Nostoc sp.]|uniref:terpene synthase family protein n=1 Tax=Nostoc sp. TaxID=1180 RepID=UPI002FF4AD3D